MADPKFGGTNTGRIGLQVIWCVHECHERIHVYLKPCCWLAWSWENVSVLHLVTINSILKKMKLFGIAAHYRWLSETSIMGNAGKEAHSDYYDHWTCTADILVEVWSKLEIEIPRQNACTNDITHELCYERTGTKVTWTLEYQITTVNEGSLPRVSSTRRSEEVA
jgi:hypothetical protein